MQRFREVFGEGTVTIGMIHTGALPGTPRHRASLEAIVAQAVDEAGIYAEAGVPAVLLENMHDVPYLKGGVGPEITAAMAVVAAAVGDTFPGPVGVQVLAGANREALAVARAAGLQFVRVEGFVFGHVADEGWLDGCAGDLLRYRRAIGADDVLVLADVKKKHAAHAVTADVPLGETAAAAEFCGADGVIVTGVATGQPTAPEDLTAVREACGLPVVVGSGVSARQLPALVGRADGLIVGSHFKVDGRWDRPVDPARVEAFLAALAAVGEATD